MSLESPNKIKLPEEKKSIEICKLVVGDKGYNVETRKNTFFYPEQIQKETGIIGYERQSIDFKNLQEIIQDSFKGKTNLVIGNSHHGTDIVDAEYYKQNEDKLSIPGKIESYADLKDKFTRPQGSLLTFLIEKTKNMTKEEGDEFERSFLSHLNGIEKSRYIAEAIVLDLCKSFTKEEFPNQTYNHVMGAMGGQGISEEQKQELFSDRVFLQKIAHGESGDSSYKFFSTKTKEEIKEILLNFKGKEVKISPHIALYLAQRPGAWENLATDRRENFNIPDIPVEEREDFLKLAEEHIKSNLINNDKITRVNFQGMSVQDFGLWGGPHNLFKTPVFGFSTEDGLFKEYLQKTKELFNSSEDMRENQYEYSRRQAGWQTRRIVKKSIDYALNHPHSTKEQREERLHEANTGDMDNHPWIPLVVNNASIHELRWGSCTYAVIPTEKGLNFIKMIHKTESNKE